MTVDSSTAGPAGRVWWLLGGPEVRLHLHELPADFGVPAGPYFPSPPTADEDPVLGL